MRIPRPRARSSIALLLLLLSACGPASRIRYEERLAETPVPARHWLESERLSQVMRRLDRLASERLPQAFDVHIERERQVEEVVRIARSMAESAERIPDTVADAPFDEDERAEFLGRARALRESAQWLADEAEGLSPEELRAQVRAIEESCGGCHRRFRDSLGVDWESPQADGRRARSDGGTA
jgi:cytochrome c556